MQVDLLYIYVLIHLHIVRVIPLALPIVTTLKLPSKSTPNEA